MREWIVPDEDIGVDGAYFDYKELIRCKDCKWWKDKTSYRDYSICVDYERAMGPDDYCSRAERKE